MRRLDEAVRGWAEAHWKNDRHCPICGSRDWIVNNELSRLMELHLVESGDVNISPLVEIACSTCGYLFFVNARSAGLYTAEELLDIYHGRAVLPGSDEAGGFPLTPDGER
jgi:predicted nucleic-acid-binding Zn-ribbon protein